ncbi:MAG: ABC transporter permease subunit [Oscillospiraceae bacterium]|nr:ABC transporter permease subunit [Oscillospiraceae bacterium]
MIRYILRRLLLLIPVIILVSFIVFTLMDLAPGDAISGLDLGNMSMEEIAALRAEMGLDDPLLVRYGRYMFRLVQGDLGVGDFSGISVWENFITRLPNTLILAFFTVIIGVSIAIPLGIFAARRSGKVSDNITTGFTMIGMSMPGFWLGVLMMLLFSDVLGWFPAGGFNHGLRSVVLPAVVASMTLLAACTRQTRSSMLEVLKADYLRTARAKGVSEHAVIRKHALGNALIPIVTTVGVSVAIAVSGTAVIEAVFAWPGVGRFIVESVAARDVTSTTGAVILTTVLYVLILLMVDLAYAFIDPRIRAQYTKSGRKKKKAEAVAIAAAQSVPEANTSAVKASEPIMTERLSDTPTKAEQAHTATEAFAQPIKKTEEHFVSFATRTAADFVHEQSYTADTVGSVIKKHKKRSRGAEVFRHLLKNPGALTGMIILAVMLILFVVALRMPFDMVTSTNVAYRNSPPSFEFLFGSDHMGRNLFYRVVYATRFSLPIGIGATAIAALGGVFLGSISAFFEGSVADEIIMRFSDALASIPGILLGMVIITTLGRSVPNLIIAIGVSAIPVFIRISRASILTLKGNEFVEAAKAIGLSNFRILYTQVLPNGLAPIMITFTASLGMAILISAGLSFLGFGIPVPNPEWGALVSTGREWLRTAPWLTIFPGLFIMLTVMAFNLLGDGLRDAFDPKLKK